MSASEIDQLATVKASLELMVSDNAEIHEYFKDLLEKVSELDEETPESRRKKFGDLVSMGAFRFNGVDVRLFAQTHHQPLPPPLFLTRTRRRLQNTRTLLEEFARRGVYEDAEQLRGELDLLASHVVNEHAAADVRDFKAKVDALRESSLFRSYLETKTRFIRKDAALRADAEFLAAKESVEEGEELLRQRKDDLDELSRQLDEGAVALDEAQARLEQMTLEGAGASPVDGEPAELLADPAASAAAEAVAEALDAAGAAPADEPKAPAKKGAAPGGRRGAR
jgi:hypothetical protein